MNAANPDLLNLPGLQVKKVYETASQYTIEVTIRNSQREKPCCLLFDLARRNGRKTMRFIDLPTHGKFVELVLKRQYYICKCAVGISCDRIPPDIDPERRMTARLMRYIETKSASETFAAVSEETGLSAKTVRNVFKAYVDRRLFNYQFETPTVIGVDEKHLNNKFRFVVGNVIDRTLLDMLPNRDLPDLHIYFNQMKDRGRIQVWCQDMNENYKTLQRRYAPEAQLVVDKFHVLKLAGDTVERIRRGVNSSLPNIDRRRLKRQRTLLLARHYRLGDRSKDLLEYWFAQAPVLRDAYEAKEMLFAVYDWKKRDDALRWYDEWKSQLSGPVGAEFGKIAKTIERWHDGVFGYFQHPYTNAYVESVNRLIGDFNRDGRGYEFETLRAKALLTYGIHRTVKPKIIKGAPLPDDDTMALIDMDDIFAFDEAVALPKNYGASIDELLRLISNSEW